MRTNNHWLGVVALPLLMALMLALPVQAQAVGTLEGVVVNGTADGPQIGAGVSVTLYVVQGDAEVDSLETTTGADGRFRFEGLETGSDLEYWPEVTYLGVPYSPAEPYRFEAGQTALETTVTVYETTGDDSAIRIDSVHIIAESFGEVLRISEIQLFGNAGDRAYVGGDGDVDQGGGVYIPLPSGAVGVAFDEAVAPDRFVQLEGGLLDSEPVPPGSAASLAFFSYHLLVDGDTVSLVRSFSYPVIDLSVLVAQPGLALRSEQMQSMGIELFQGREYQFYAAQNLTPDMPLAMELIPQAVLETDQGAGGMPVAGESGVAGTPTKGNQGLLLWIGIGLAGLAVIGAVIYPVVTRRPASAPPPDLASDRKAKRLLADLADLEESFEVGQVDEAAYEHRRAELYKELQSL